MIKLFVAVLIGATSHVEELRTVYGVKEAAVADVSTVQHAILIFPFGVVSISTIIGDLDEPIAFRTFGLWCDPHLESCHRSVLRKSGRRACSLNVNPADSGP